jgi:asparagine synthase (glutamine-hydrolysing)
MARRQHTTLSTLTVRFGGLRGTAADEGPIAARVAASLGTDHREVELSADELRALWPAALAAMDQPSIDGFNTFVISRAAHVAGFKVVLSGLGGDELFGGYSSFRDIPRLVRTLRIARHLPGSRALWPRLASSKARPKLSGLLSYGHTLPGAYLLRRGLFLPEELPGLLGRDVAVEALRQYSPLGDIELALAEPTAMGAKAQNADPWLAVHQMETARYLRHQLLRDSDWASMAWSVELRVPFVDRVLRAEVARAGFGPMRHGGKVAVVKQAAPELPDVLFERRKTGFYVPLAEALHAGAATLSHGERSRMLAVEVLRQQAIGLKLPPQVRPAAATSASKAAVL